MKKPNNKKKLPRSFKPELAVLSKSLTHGDEWIYETKYDGYRILAFVENGAIRLMSRNNKDWTDKFPELLTDLKKLKLQNTILDGEVVAVDKHGKSNFQLLQNYFMESSKAKNLHYFVFDLPFYNGDDLTELPLIERKKILKTKLFKKHYPHLHYSEHLTGSAKKLLQAACKHGLEGIMAKQKQSTYEQKRTSSWLKLKCHHRQEFIVIGYTEPQGGRTDFGALLLGVYGKNKKLVYCGHVGTGFNQQTLKELHKKLTSLQQDKMPLVERPKDPLARKVHWVKPKLVIEVEFTEWTEEGSLRHPSFQGIREDKPAKLVRREYAKIRINSSR